MNKLNLIEARGRANNCYEAIWQATKIKFQIDLAIHDPVFSGFLAETGEAFTLTHDITQDFGSLAVGTTRGKGKVFVIAHIREADGVWVVCREVSESTRQSVVDAFFKRFENGFHLADTMMSDDESNYEGKWCA